MRVPALAIGLSLTLVATSVQAMSVEAFLASAARIPRNPTALLHPATRRLTDEVRSGFRTIRDEQRSAAAAGRTPTTCVPDRISVSAGEVLDRMNAVPVGRRSISVTTALREWMAERYPCR